MMSKDDGFRRQKWDKRTSQTEIPHAPISETSPEVQMSTTASAPITKKGKSMLWLIISSPQEHRGTVLPIAAGAIIGRHGDIRWHDVRMSRKHAQFIMVSDPVNPAHEIFAIEPLQDRNGTMVNGRRISDTAPLHENDVIIMGDTRFVVKVLE